MKRKLISLLLVLVLFLTAIPMAAAASDEANAAAQELYEQGLFMGIGTDTNGNPIFDLDRAPTRHEAVTMLVRLLGKGSEAEAGTWETPFTDVADWAKPYVGYAYANGLTTGTSATTYSGTEIITATQYLTFVLRALGYSSSEDFQWDKAWECSDTIGLTSGQYDETTVNFTRSDVAIISRDALGIYVKEGSATLGETIGADVELKGETPATPETPAPVSFNGIWQKCNSNGYVIQELNLTDGEFEEFTTGSYCKGTYTFDGTTLTLTIALQVNFAGINLGVRENPQTKLYILNSEGALSSEDGYTTLVKGEKIELADNMRPRADAYYDQYKLTGDADLVAVSYDHMAISSFRNIKSQYPSATPEYAYIKVFKNLNGELCVLIDLRYRIITTFSQLTLHNLTTNTYTNDPVDYYNNLANRAYGASKLQYMKLANEINAQHIEMLRAMSSILSGGPNTTTGYFMDAAALSR